ncbi:MAG TPA: hypothetical protein VGY13_12080 [Solirubrobacteraceae bacterium]|jgi:hypothetical protein|nr:hypothetical protein [Solirubrobacteraceae bacterium]
MSEFLSSVKADLLDRRLLPLVALVVLGLVGAVAWVALGGSSSPTTSAHVASVAPTAPAGLAVTQTTSEKAVAETTGGVALQHKGSSRDPFAPVPSAKKASTKSASGSNASSSGGSSSKSSSSSSSGSGSSSGGSGSSGSGSGESTPSTPSKPSSPSKPAAPKTVYHVAVLFGPVPAEAGAQSQLTPFENIKLLTPLPSPKQPLIVFRGVKAGGKSATFSLVSEAILHGNGACVPSNSQCQAVELQSGQSEQLQYVTEAGQSEIYELKVVSIVSAKASSAAVEAILRSESKAGREVLDQDGLLQLPGLRYSTQAGVLVLAGHPAFGGVGRSSGHHHS